MRLMFSAINCTLDTSNGAAISIKTFLRMLSRHGVECRSFSASVYDRPAPGTALQNLRATGALPVQEPGLPQTLWLGVDEDVHHYVEFVPAMTQRDFPLAHEQLLLNRALAVLDSFKPDVLLLYGNRRYERTLLKVARERGIATVFYLVNPGYKEERSFEHVDLVFTDTEATRQLYRERFGFDCRVIGKFIDKPALPANAGSKDYVTFINPSPEKGVTLFYRILELAAATLPEAKFLVVESRKTLEEISQRTQMPFGNFPNLRRVGLQRDMGAVFGATKVLLVPSLWHDSGPRVVVEACAMGIPLVTTDRGGVAELAGEAAIVITPPEPLVRNHWLIPPVSEAIPWVEALRALLTDSEVYDKYSAAATAQWQRHDPALRLPGIVADLEAAVAAKTGATA
jgi:glycosyltransferase involved in cell wall biosynthesis